MTRDRSLDEFATGDASDSSEPADGGSDPTERDSTDAEDHTSTDDSEVGKSDDSEVGKSDDSEVKESEDSEVDDPAESIEVADVDPATATYQWDPEGLECPACGRTVDRLWTQEDERVCADCKEW